MGGSLLGSPGVQTTNKNKRTKIPLPNPTSPLTKTTEAAFKEGSHYFLPPLVLLSTTNTNETNHHHYHQQPQKNNFNSAKFRGM